jgi:transcriptional regulator with XRE-family HTH domain
VGRSPTLTGVRGATEAPELGVVSGFLFKLLRGSIGCTQADLAERLGVDNNTIQGWESGRRPLAAMRAVELVRLGRQMTHLGAPAGAVSLLATAVTADEFLTTAVRAGDSHIPLFDNPLANMVHRRDFVALVTWPFTGIVPSPLRHLPMPKARGPVTDRPQLPAGLRRRFFDQMMVSADTAGNDGNLIRRQATYLLGFDDSAASTAWLAAQHERTAVRSIDSHDVPAGILSRSASLALARQGDLDPVRHFIQGTLSEDKQMLGALTYWAYWLGEIPETYSDDDSMLTNTGDLWSGRRLIEHLITHLSDATNAEMNIHSLLGLVMARRGLLESDPALRRRTIVAIDQADGETLSRHARSELANLRFAAQLASR